jgi:hypothetical protein
MVSNPIEQAKVWPWLMHISKQDGTCKMFDPLRCEHYTLQVEVFNTNMDRHVFRSSKDGWVVASAGLDNDDIFVINPFTEDIVDLPDTAASMASLPRRLRQLRAALSSPSAALPMASL